MFKERIQQNFNRAARTYDSVSAIQLQSAQHLVACLKQQIPTLDPNHVIDIGSGTGFVINELHHHHPNCHYIANDISTDMLERAAINLSNVKHLSLQPGDAETIIIPEVDLIISNLSFQWFNNFTHTLKRFWDKTNVLAFTTIADGTFKQWHEAHQKIGISQGVKKYLTHAALQQICLELNPASSFFDFQSYELYFNSPEQFIRYVQQLGVSNPDPCYPRMRLPEVLKELKEGFNANYEIFTCILQK